MTSTFRLRPIQRALILALAGFAPWAHALKLGDPVVKSYVGQPLVAEFTIEDSTAEELRRLKINLARPEMYSAARTNFHPALKTSSISIEQKDKPVVVLRTEGPIEDAVVDILFELSWAAGKMMQTATILIDPPPSGVKIDTPATTMLPIVTAAPSVVTPQEPMVAETIPVQVRTVEPVQEKVSTVTVQKGDTLGKIAKRVNIEGVKIEQVLIALYNKNSNVITSKNINLIREGLILALPTKDEVLAVNSTTALATVALHASNFRMYAQTLAERAPSTATVSNTVTGTVQKANVSVQTPVKKAEDKVHIGKGEQGDAKHIAEQKIQQEKAAKEAAEKKSILEKNLKELEEISKVQNAQMAAMQKAATTKKPEPAEVGNPEVKTKGLVPPPVKPGASAAAVTSEEIKTEKAHGPASVGAPVLPDSLKPNDALKDPTAANATPTPSATPAVQAPAAAVEKKSELSSDPSQGANNVVLQDPSITKPSVPAVTASPAEGPAKVTAKPVIQPAAPAPVAEKEGLELAQEVLMEHIPEVVGGLGLLTLLGGWLYTRRQQATKRFVAANESASGKGKADTESSEVSADEETMSNEPLAFDTPSDVLMQDIEDDMVEQVSPQIESRHDVSEWTSQIEPTEQVETSFETMTYDGPSFVEQLDPKPAIPVDERINNMHVENDLSIPELSAPVAESYSLESSLSLPQEFQELPELGDLPDLLTQEMPSESEPSPEPMSTTTSNVEEFNFALPSFDSDTDQSIQNDLAQLSDQEKTSVPTEGGVSLTYDPQEQLGIAKFYMGLQDYQGVYDMVKPLLENEDPGIREHAKALFADLPEEFHSAT